MNATNQPDTKAPLTIDDIILDLPKKMAKRRNIDLSKGRNVRAFIAQARREFSVKGAK